MIWGGAATTPGSVQEMLSQRAEHAGSIAILILLDIFQKCIQVQLHVLLWIDNVEMIRRGNWKADKGVWSDTLVLDYDLWKVTEKVVEGLNFTFS